MERLNKYVRQAGRKVQRASKQPQGQPYTRNPGMNRSLELQTMPYEEYLRTPEWQEKREIALRLAEYRCQVCNADKDLNVHHRTYERRGREALADLTVLCQPCHELFHSRTAQKPEIDPAEYAFCWLGKQWDNSALHMNRLFSTFNQRMSGVKEAFDIAQEYCNNPDGMLIFAGGHGVGKTHLMAAICNAALSNKTKCLYVSAPQLFSAIQCARQNNEDYYHLIEKSVEAEILFLDDIDKVKWSEFREEVYFAIIDAREKWDMPMVLSTDRMEDVPKQVGQAVCSRLKSHIIPIIMDKASDYRERRGAMYAERRKR